MIFFSQFQKIAETRRQQIFLRIHKVLRKILTQKISKTSQIQFFEKSMHIGKILEFDHLYTI